MRGKQPIALSDVQKIVQLCNQLHEMSGDSNERKLLWLKGLCDIMPARSASALVARLPGKTAPPIPISLVQTHPRASSDGSRQLPDDFSRLGNLILRPRANSRHRLSRRECRCRDGNCSIRSCVLLPNTKVV